MESSFMKKCCYYAVFSESLFSVFRITSKWTYPYLRPQKVPNTLKFWDKDRKDVSKRPEFPEIYPSVVRRASDEKLGSNNIVVLGKLQNPASSGNVLGQR